MPPASCASITRARSARRRSTRRRRCWQPSPAIKREFAAAAREEEEHLAWTQQRLAELDDRPSLLNPLWYAGSFAIGIAAGFAGDRVNLGFVVETERQVEEHLTAHMERLPAADAKSRAIVEKMRDDEARHGAAARAAGAADLPFAGEGPDARRGGRDAVRRLPRLAPRVFLSAARRAARTAAATRVGAIAPRPAFRTCPRPRARSRRRRRASRRRAPREVRAAAASRRRAGRRQRHGTRTASSSCSSRSGRRSASAPARISSTRDGGSVGARRRPDASAQRDARRRGSPAGP